MPTVRVFSGYLLVSLFFLLPSVLLNASGQGSSRYDELLLLFAEWRQFELPAMLDGAPDYTAEGFAARYESFLVLRSRLHRIDHGEWPVPQQVDWHIVRAEMNGFDFNHQVLQPWVRDPAFYDSICESLVFPIFPDFWHLQGKNSKGVSLLF